MRQPCSWRETLRSELAPNPTSFRHSKCSRSMKVPGVTAQPPHHCKTPATSVGCDPREVTPRATKPEGGALGTDTIMRSPLLTHSRYFSQGTTRVPTGSVAQSQKVKEARQDLNQGRRDTEQEAQTLPTCRWCRERPRNSWRNVSRSKNHRAK